MDAFELRPSAEARRRFGLKPAAAAPGAPDDPAAAQAPEAADAAFDWRFGVEEGGGHATPLRRATASAEGALLTPYQGPEGVRRADGVRRRLDAALEAWWREQALPPDALLRDGLLVLEAGHALDEAQRTLLARTALARGRGLLTALHHQSDPERVAGLLREAILDGVLDPEGAVRLRAADEAAAWLPPLLRDLRADRYSPNATAAARAAAAVAALDAQPAPPAEGVYALSGEGVPPRRVPRRAAQMWIVPVGVALVVLIGALLAAALVMPPSASRLPAWLPLWGNRGAARVERIAVPGGVYAVTPGADGLLSARRRQPRPLDAFVIDRTEVTNRAYRACVEAGGCTLPAEPASATRPDYFLNPAYDSFPVLHVTWEQARAYCGWAGMRLPTPAEWEVTATWAPATERFYRYPWGEEWQPALVIGGGGALDTAAVGSRSPQGDSPLGAADMAGNVAEWTSGVPAFDPELAMVRGGSWRSGREGLLPLAFLLTRKGAASGAIGFRCAGDG